MALEGEGFSVAIAEMGIAESAWQMHYERTSGIRHMGFPIARDSSNGAMLRTVSSLSLVLPYDVVCQGQRVSPPTELEVFFTFRTSRFLGNNGIKGGNAGENVAIGSGLESFDESLNEIST